MTRTILLMALAFATPAAAQTQTQMNAEAGAQWKTADAAMTAQWKRSYAYMQGRDSHDRSRGGGFGYAPALLNSQRAWLSFRDKQCVIEGAQFAGGSAQPMARLQCLVRLTKERTVQLRNVMWQQ